jgi:hypothetical protein
MRRSVWVPIVILSLGSVTALTGCAAAPGTDTPACVETPYITPATVTLDHTSPPPANSVQFTTGTQYVGKMCPQTPLRAQYYWSVSDTTDASITSPGGVATCVSEAPSPIVVSSLIETYSVTTGPGYAPSGLPSATLICK